MKATGIYISSFLIILLGALLAAGFACKGGAGEPALTPTPTPTPVLSDYPYLFLGKALIVVSADASQMEQEAAMMIANQIKKRTGYKQPSIKSDIEVSQEDKAGSNLILIAITGSNPLLNEVYEITGIDEVTQEYPGVNKSRLEILANPWNTKKSLLVAVIPVRLARQ